MTSSSAASYGHLNVVKWCRENGLLMDEETVIQAAANGHMNVFEWCRANGYPVPDYYAHLE